MHRIGAAVLIIDFSGGFLPSLVKQVMAVPKQYAKAAEERKKKLNAKTSKKHLKNLGKSTQRGLLSTMNIADYHQLFSALVEGAHRDRPAWLAATARPSQATCMVH